MSSVNDRQVGGTHYVSSNQHWDFVPRHGIPYLEACALKYVTRNRKKHLNPRLDLEKAIHYLEKVLSLLDEGVIDILNLQEKDQRKLRVAVFQYARANKLSLTERDICLFIVNWTQREHLMNAIYLIYSLLSQCPPEAR